MTRRNDDGIHEAVCPWKELARREGSGENGSAIGPGPIAKPAERYRCGAPTPRFEDLAGVVRDRPGTFATA